MYRVNYNDKDELGRYVKPSDIQSLEKPKPGIMIQGDTPICQKLRNFVKSNKCQCVVATCKILVQHLSKLDQIQPVTKSMPELQYQILICSPEILPTVNLIRAIYDSYNFINTSTFVFPEENLQLEQVEALLSKLLIGERLRSSQADLVLLYDLKYFKFAEKLYRFFMQKLQGLMEPWFDLERIPLKSWQDPLEIRLKKFQAIENATHVISIGQDSVFEYDEKSHHIITKNGKIRTTLVDPIQGSISFDPSQFSDHNLKNLNLESSDLVQQIVDHVIYHEINSSLGQTLLQRFEISGSNPNITNKDRSYGNYAGPSGILEKPPKYEACIDRVFAPCIPKEGVIIKAIDKHDKFNSFGFDVYLPSQALNFDPSIVTFTCSVPAEFENCDPKLHQKFEENLPFKIMPDELALSKKLKSLDCVIPKEHVIFTHPTFTIFKKFTKMDSNNNSVEAKESIRYYRRGLVISKDSLAMSCVVQVDGQDLKIGIEDVKIIPNALDAINCWTGSGPSS